MRLKSLSIMHNNLVNEANRCAERLAVGEPDFVFPPQMQEMKKRLTGRLDAYRATLRNHERLLEQMAEEGTAKNTKLAQHMHDLDQGLVSLLYDCQHFYSMAEHHVGMADLQQKIVMTLGDDDDETYLITAAMIERKQGVTLH